MPYSKVRAGTYCMLFMAVSACSVKGDPSKAIEAYLQARVESKADKMISLSCPDWEAQAITEATSFESMDARLNDMACQTIGTDGSFTLVGCRGTIITSYRGETREWNLADKTYRAIVDDGEWRMCGYAAP